MSDAGPYSRTRAASRASRESTPVPSNPLRQNERPTREATPVTARRTGGRAANRLAPTTRDGDDALPPVTNKDSKAYGSSGKLKGPVQMDVAQAFQRPDLALDTALAQSRAREVGHLPTLAENTVETLETQPQLSQQSYSSPQGASDHIGGPQHARKGAVEENGDRTFGVNETSAWAPRAGEGRMLLRRLKNFFHVVSTWIGSILLVVHRSITAFFANRSNFDLAFWLFLFLVLFYIFELTHGPLLWFDPPLMRALRQGTAISYSPKTDVSGPRIQVVENRLSSLERIIHNFFITKPKSDIPLQINWFEIGQGAVIDPYYSSPSYVPKDDFTLTAYFTSLFTLRQHSPAPITFSQGPAEALMHWNDGGLDRWCAPSSRGKLQLMVNVARTIAPHELIIEHVARSATILVGMAPREVELWVDIQDVEAFYVLERAILASEPSLLDTSSSQPDTELAPAQALPGTFLPVARVYYDVHSNQAVQSFAIPFNLAAMGIKTSRVAIRVNSNWGSYDATCVNRLRLHGVDMSGEKEEELGPALDR